MNSVDRNYNPSYSGIIYCVRRYVRVPILLGTLLVSIPIHAASSGSVQYNVADPVFHQGNMDRVFQERQVPKVENLDIVIPQSGNTVNDERLKEIKFHLKEINLEGGTVFPKEELLQAFSALLKDNQEVSLADVFQIAEGITTHYREAGYMLSRAVVPTQHVRTDAGVVRVVIVEGFVQNVLVELSDDNDNTAKEKFSHVKNRIQRYMDRILASKPLRSQDMERYLLLINDLDGVTAKVILHPDKDISGASDMTLKVGYKPYSGNVKLDNMGSKIMGPGEVSLTGAANSPFGYGEQFKLMSVLSNRSITSQPIELLYGDIAMKLPIGDEGFLLKTELTKTQTQPGNRLQSLHLNAQTSGLSLAGVYPVRRSRALNLFAEGGVKWVDSKADAQNAPIYSDHIRKAYLRGSLDFTDSYRGVNLISLQVDQGLNIDGATPQGQQLTSQYDASPNFSKITGEISRLQMLPWNLSILASAMGQYTSHPLLSSEQIAVGGTGYGRGYDLNEINGDRGHAEKLELQYNGNTSFGSITPYIFADNGQVRNLGANAQTSLQNESITSIGLGVRGNIGKRFNYETYVAKPTTRTPINEGSNNPRLFGQVSINF